MATLEVLTSNSKPKRSHPRKRKIDAFKFQSLLINLQLSAIKIANMFPFSSNQTKAATGKNI